MLRFKISAKKRILVRENSPNDQKFEKKNTFPMEFFNEIWLKVGEHKKH